MSPRETSTGAVLEQMVLPALTRGGYQYRTQVYIGARLGGARHKVDAIANQGDRQWLISMKWQQVSGTAEQKVPFEVICLADAVLSGLYERAYLVLGVLGWSVRESYVGDGLKIYIARTNRISVASL